MGCFLILDNNYIDEDRLNDYDVSSEKTGYEGTNTFNEKNRSRSWRSDGYWNITSSNNTIVFRETTGVDLTATVATGEYRTHDSFATVIRDALEAGGASSYRVGVDPSTYRWEISSDGLGGGGIFELMWTSDTVFGDLIGFDTTSDDTGALSYIADSLKITENEFIVFDMGISCNPTAFVLLGNRNSPIAISPGATIKIQGSETDVWTSPSYEATISYNSRAFFKFDADGFHSDPLRFWRVSISDLTNANRYIEVNSLFLGEHLSVSRGAVQFPFRGTMLDLSKTSISENGQTFTDIHPQSESWELQWFGLTIDDKEQMDLFFENYGTHSPFFVSMDREQVLSSEPEYYVRYVKRTAEPRYELISPGVYNLTMTIREEL